MLKHTTEIDTIPPSTIRYSIGTLVTDKNEYQKMLDSFFKAGFDLSFCEYLYIDNCQHNKYDAFAGLNRLLSAASGQYIILCHQDVLLNHDTVSDLDKRITKMDKLDDRWAVLGNSGGHRTTAFYQEQRQLLKKYRYAFRPRFIRTSCESLFITGNKIACRLMNIPYVMKKMKRLFKWGILR